MAIYLILFLIIIGLIFGLIVWIIRLIRLYRKGKKKSFAIQVSILSLILIFLMWELQLFPLSKNFYIQDRTTELTGKKFWSWKEYDFEELGIRGEGYSLDIYKFNEETAAYFEDPGQEFYNNFPSKKHAVINWTKTPIKESDQEILEFVTPIYGGWKGEIIERQNFIRQIANQPGSYYSYSGGGSRDFYLIAPKKRLVILIYHNM